VSWVPQFAPVATSKSPTYGRVKIPQGLDRTG
jgi:hypothetical protein